MNGNLLKPVWMTSMKLEGKKYSHEQEKKVEWFRMDIKDGGREWK